ncbi:MAG: hypothetical protein EAX96_09105 [Candidatus Lokiarchaeota archaeon]|nr:hypothetical protein [Candidatus Lokiarchaeota archaeon]
MEEEIKKLRLFKITILLFISIYNLLFDLFYYLRSFLGDFLYFLSLIVVAISLFLIFVINNYLIKLDKYIKKDFNEEFRYFYILSILFAALPPQLGAGWFYSLNYLFFICIPFQVVGFSICFFKVLKYYYFKS